MEIVDYDPETCIIVTKNSKELEDDLYQGFTRPRATDFYYLQNSIFAVTEPGEYFHDTSKGILYYYPYDDDDLETVETWMAVADHTLNFNGIKSATFQNLSFRYTTGVALGGILFSNLLVENCDFKHCETGLSILFSNNTVMNHLLFEDMGSMAV
ncbi:hypothetical protein TRFO_04404 [Tritrichomonas foetus]|uniref:Right handed beta helix domain-containing protein n=1 Tax=Tritrichomonas foetus TaxID=1144522 RepID=A0A1J4KJJ6_9EUKA|nr:hypothetical protein TRFO_04404 [Tritrichomonas foetus]|eukprot:OHT09870.1 hypothetical protein TRFO_04404 [Tritrichomonas foetus]